MKNFKFLLFLLIFNSQLFCADGDLDPSFDGDGRVTTDFFGNNDSGNGIVIQTDQKIVAVGFAANVVPRFALARYNTDGSLDTNFGGQGGDPAGRTTTLIGTSSIGNEVDIQIDGKIVVAGDAVVAGVVQFALARYHGGDVLGIAGTLDITFNGTGTKTTIIGTSSSASDLEIQPDGKIIAAGSATIAGKTRVALVRYLTTGLEDPTFGTAGIVSTDLDATGTLANAVLLQSSGKIVVVGSAIDQSFIFLARYNSDGSVDTTFGPNSTGVVKISLGTILEGTDIKAQSDGKLVISGFTNVGGIFQFLIARFSADGIIDTTFGSSGTGIEITDITSSPFEFGNSLAIQSWDQKIVVGGRANVGIDNFALARYSANGIIDPTFTSGEQPGIVLTAFSPSDGAFINDIAIQANHRIVALGQNSLGGTQDFALARYIADTSTFVTITFPTEGSNVSSTPTITGTTEIGNSVEIFIDGVSVGFATVDASGNFIFQVTTPLSQGTHTVLAFATDLAGNTAQFIVTFNILLCETNIDALTQAIRSKYGT